MTFEIKHLLKKVYYSQNREDLLLEAFFPDKKDGFYVDIGGYDPDYDSVTKLFYKKGWKGINVEPQLSRFNKFVKERPRDINLNCGVSDKNGTLTLREYQNGGLSTFSSEMKNDYVGKSDPGVVRYEDIEVPVTTLKDIFSKYTDKTINFMKVDVEGLEYEVLAGNDWGVYRPQVLCVEANHILKDWKELIEKQGYKCVFFDGLNEYYIDSYNKDIRPFDYVKHVLFVRGGGLSYSDYKEVKFLNEQTKKMAAQVESLSASLGNQLKKNEELEYILASPRILIKKLTKLSFDRLKQKIGGGV